MVKKTKSSKSARSYRKKSKNVSRPPRVSPQQSILAKAVALHQAGRLQEAEAHYRQILQTNPNHVQALHYLGILAQEVGKGEIAVELLRRALALKPDYVEAHYDLAHVLDTLGRVAEAIASYRRVLALSPDYLASHYNLGILLQSQSRLKEAEDCFRKALSLKQDFVEAHNNLGITLQAQGKLEEAAASYRRALALKPDYPAAHSNLGLLLQAQGKLNEAAASFRQALALKPDYAAASSNLGIVLKDQGKLDEAVASFQRALELQPDYPEVYYNLGIVYRKQGNTDKAIVNFERALSLKPDYVEAHNNLGSILKDQGKLDEAVASFRRALALQPDCAEVHSNLLACLNYLPNLSVSEYLEEARQYGRNAAAKVSDRFLRWPCSLTTDCLRVGMVSGDFRNHPVGYFLENLLASIDPGKVALLAYPTNRGEDELTGRIRPRFVAWKPIADLDDKAAARLIYDDAVHILLDLSGHTSGNRLPVFAWKPAPVQATWLGYFASTGLAEMDYIVADPVSVPLAHNDHFTEMVWNLPETRLCFSPLAIAEEFAATFLPARRNGYVTFGCLQNLAKLNDAVFAVWGQILAKMPQARLRLQNPQFNVASVREEFQERMARVGAASERVTFANQEPGRHDYLAAHSHIDIILDTFPFTGGTTTCEALWLGVPTLTLAGETMVSRQGASLLACAGLADWIAQDAAEYVAKAIAHASDLEKLTMLRAGLRRQVSATPLFDGPRFARNFETALWGMWHCCKKKLAE